MAQAATYNTILGPNDGWEKVATDPLNCTIHSNGEVNCQLAITIADAEPTITGEKHYGRMDWQCGGLVGYIWIKSPDIKMEFAITVET